MPGKPGWPKGRKRKQPGTPPKEVTKPAEVEITEIEAKPAEATVAKVTEQPAPNPSPNFANCDAAMSRRQASASWDALPGTIIHGHWQPLMRGGRR